MDPFFRWPGGKRWLAPGLAAVAGATPYDRYMEPFAGAAAGFFRIQPARAVLADSNSELIDTFTAVAAAPRSVHAAVQALPTDRDQYEIIRRCIPTTQLDAAARFLYLRAHAFGGLYRVNRRGEFNVPYGGLRRKQVSTVSELETASKALQTVSLLNQGFESTLALARRGDLVYLDPPYVAPRPGTESFNRYLDNVFTDDDQRVLGKLAAELADSGVYVVVSNSYTSLVRSIYSSNTFHRFRIERPSNVARSPAQRGHVSELLAVSRSVPRSESTLRRMIRLAL